MLVGFLWFGVGCFWWVDGLWYVFGSCDLRWFAIAWFVGGLLSVCGGLVLLGAVWLF